MGFVRCMGYGDGDLEANKHIEMHSATKTITPSSPYIAMKQVKVDVPLKQSYTVTSNGTYSPESQYMGFRSVTVNVPSGTLANINTVKFDYTIGQGTESSPLITIVNSGKIMIESSYYLDGSSIYSSFPDIYITVLKNGETALTKTCQLGGPIGYSGTSNNYIPLIDVAAGDEIQLQALVSTTGGYNITKVAFVIYYF